MANNQLAESEPLFEWSFGADIPVNLPDHLPGHLPLGMEQVVRGVISPNGQHHHPEHHQMSANGMPRSSTRRDNRVPTGFDLGVGQDAPPNSVVVPMEDENQNTERDAHHGQGNNEHGHSHNGAPDQHAHAHNGNGGGGGAQPDWRLLVNAGIFVLILFLRLMSDHILELLVVVGLYATLYYANKKMVQHIHQASVRDVSGTYRRSACLSQMWLAVFVAANIVCVYYTFSDQQLWNALIFQLPATWQVDLWSLFWVTVVTDFMLKFVAVILKSLVTMLPQMCLAQKRRGKYYMCIEHVIQLYRCLLPISPWGHFLIDEQHAGKWVFGLVLIIIYALFKLCMLWGKMAEVIMAIRKLRIDKNYGVLPSHADLSSRGEGCPICQDDFKDPVMLSCKHIFCENCVTVWFDREKTCPMCRAQIHADTTLWRDGGTSAHIQWY